MILLNKTKIAQSFNQAAKNYDQAAVLQQEVGQRLFERLEFVRLQPETILDLGSGTGKMTELLMQHYPEARILALDIAHSMLSHAKQYQPSQQHFICADAEYFPLPTQSVDFIYSNLMLQWCPDLTKVFAECNRVLKPNGLLLFSTLGPSSLQELRQSLATSYTHPFIDLHNIGDQLIKAGFADPVLDREDIILGYREATGLLSDLKNLGEYDLLLSQDREYSQNLEAYETYRYENGMLPATFEVIYGLAWGKIAVTHKNMTGEVTISVVDIKKQRSNAYAKR